MTAAQANTPAKRIYLAVQLMYTSRDPRLHHETYFILMRDLVQAAPSAWPHVVAVSNHILAGEMYKALKCAKTLIAYEKELLDHEVISENETHFAPAGASNPGQSDAMAVPVKLFIYIK